MFNYAFQNDLGDTGYSTEEDDRQREFREEMARKHQAQLASQDMAVDPDTIVGGTPLPTDIPSRDPGRQGAVEMGAAILSAPRGNFAGAMGQGIQAYEDAFLRQLAEKRRIQQQEFANKQDVAKFEETKKRNLSDEAYRKAQADRQALLDKEGAEDRVEKDEARVAAEGALAGIMQDESISPEIRQIIGSTYEEGMDPLPFVSLAQNMMKIEFEKAQIAANKPAAKRDISGYSPSNQFMEVDGEMIPNVNYDDPAEVEARSVSLLAAKADEKRQGEFALSATQAHTQGASYAKDSVQYDITEVNQEIKGNPDKYKAEIEEFRKPLRAAGLEYDKGTGQWSLPLEEGKRQAQWRASMSAGAGETKRIDSSSDLPKTARTEIGREAHRLWMSGAPKSDIMSGLTSIFPISDKVAEAEYEKYKAYVERKQREARGQ